MPPELKDDIFSSGTKRGSILSSAVGASSIATDTGSSMQPPYDATTTPRKSPKKTNRLMAEKSVDTGELRPLNLCEKLKTAPDSPTNTPSRLAKATTIKTPASTSRLEPVNFEMRSSIADSQVSIYEGDEEFEQIAMGHGSRLQYSNQLASSQSSFYEGNDEYDQFIMHVDEKELDPNKACVPQNSEAFGAPSPVETVPVSSGSSLSSIKTPSLGDDSSFSSTESSRRRKRKESGPDENPRSRAKPMLEPVAVEVVRKELPRKELDVRGSKLPVGPETAVAAHTKKSKSDRPIPRSMRDPGPSAPKVTVEAISAITVGATAAKNAIQSATNSLLKSPTKSLAKPSTSTKTVVQTMAETSEITSKAPQPIIAPIKPSTESPSSEISLRTSTTSTVIEYKVETPVKVTPKAPQVPQTIATPLVTCPVSPVREKQLNQGVSSKARGPKPLGEAPSSSTPTIIAHDEDTQLLLDRNGIKKGVQYEIARGITQGWWTWKDITIGVIEDLRGSNFEKAGKVADIIKKGPDQRLSSSTIMTRQAIYAELDREQRAFIENKGRGLGLMGAYQGEENWHGGRVQLTAKLDFNKDAGKGQPPFSIRLNSFGFGKSNRATRFMTSLSILQVKVDKNILYDKAKSELVRDALSKPLVICGRQYCVFCTKECKVFFVEIKHDYQRKPMRSMGDNLRISFRRFVEVINPMELNKGQATNKWLARFQLVLSTSRPVLELEPENIFLDLDDVYGDGTDADSKSSETIMTDGCGWINLAAMRKIAAITNSNCPAAVQGRVAGAKGLWLLHPDPEHRTDWEPPMIWIRKSQLKVKLDARKEGWDRSLRIFDLVRLPRLTVPSSLYMQTILNMSQNGVEDFAFKNLMEIGLKREIEPLTKWEGENACILLAQAVQEAGGIIASRRARGAGAEARLYGYVRDERDDEDGDDNEYEVDEGLLERDAVSGCPATLYESTRDMLLAGMSPMQFPLVREKLKHVMTAATKSYMDRFRIPVILSAEAFIVPDPFGVLEEGQIYFRCSKDIGDPNELPDPHIIQGEVLVTRNPTRVSSDVRKVVAVTHDKLLPYTDVIIFSIKGKRSLASYLGGGDYDGDTVSIIAEPTLVKNFRNSEYVPEPPSVREGFEAEVEKVSVFLSRVASLGTEQKNREIFKKLLSGLSDSRVGTYSTFQDCAIYSLGYNHPDTIRLAYMFTTCLDAVKSGLRIKDDVYREDMKKWNSDRPESMQKADETIRIQNTNTVNRPLARPKSLGPFILDTLKKCGKELTDNVIIGYEILCANAESSGTEDKDLASKYIENKKWFADMKATGYSGPYESLGRIEAFVELLCEEYVSEAGSSYGNKSPQKKGSSTSVAKSKSLSQINSDYARRFAGGPPGHLDISPGLVKELKASYAHIYSARKDSLLRRSFPFAVAHETVCALKVQVKGGSSVSRKCSDFQVISANLIKSVNH